MNHYNLSIIWKILANRIWSNLTVEAITQSCLTHDRLSKHCDAEAWKENSSWHSRHADPQSEALSGNVKVQQKYVKMNKNNLRMT